MVKNKKNNRTINMEHGIIIDMSCLENESDKNIRIVFFGNNKEIVEYKKAHNFPEPEDISKMEFQNIDNVRYFLYRGYKFRDSIEDTATKLKKNVNFLSDSVKDAAVFEKEFIKQYSEQLKKIDPTYFYNLDFWYTHSKYGKEYNESEFTNYLKFIGVKEDIQFIEDFYSK